MTVSLILQKTKLLQKRKALAKSQARKCLCLVVWTKLNYRCIAFHRPKSNLKAMKHESWLLNCRKHKSVWKCFSSATLYQKVVLELWSQVNYWLTSLNELTNNLGSWEIIQHKSNKSEKKVLKIMHFCKLTTKTQLKLKQTFVVHFGVI